MILDYQKFQIPDQNQANTIIAEVNWKPEDPATNESKIIRLTLPDGKQLFVKREDFNQILFAIGDPESQRNLIPQKLETVHWRRTMLGVKAKKDIKKGELVTFPIEISFPCTTAKQIIGDRSFRHAVAKETKKDKWAMK